MTADLTSLLVWDHIVCNLGFLRKVRKRAKIRNRYNQVPHLTQDTNGKVTNSQLDIANEIQEVSHFPAGDHKASIDSLARKHNKHKTEITRMIRKKASPWNSYWLHYIWSTLYHWPVFILKNYDNI